MKSLLLMAAVATVAAVLGGCRDKKPEPVPGPQSALMQRTTTHRGLEQQRPPAVARVSGRRRVRLSLVGALVRAALPAAAYRPQPAPGRRIHQRTCGTHVGGHQRRKARAVATGARAAQCRRRHEGRGVGGADTADIVTVRDCAPGG